MKYVDFRGSEWLVEDWAKWIASDAVGIAIFSEKPDWDDEGFWVAYNGSAQAEDLETGYFAVELMEIE